MSSICSLVRSALACASVALCITTAASAQAPQLFKAGSGPDELWDVTMKMEMAGMPMAMPARTMQVCRKKNRGNEDLVPQQSNCRTTDFKTAGNRTTFTFVCTGDTPMTGTGEMTADADTYSGRIHLKGGRKGEEMDMTQTMSGKRVGSCTDTSKEAIAGIKAQGDAAAAQNCQRMMAQLAPEGFIGDGAPCKGQQKAFCDKVAGIASSGRNPAGFRAAGAQASPVVLQRAFGACGQDYEAMRKGACASGVASRDWGFVGSGTCDDDVRAQGDANCKGRSFTGMDRALGPLCSRYASLVRGAHQVDDVAVAAPAAPRAATPVNPVEDGINAVRKLLPF